MNAPAVTRHGDAHVFTWHDVGYTISVDQLHDESAGLHAEVTVSTTTLMSSGKHGHVHWARVNLSSTQARSTLAKFLTTRINHVDWNGMIEATAFLTTHDVRQGPGIIRLCDVEEVRHVEYHLSKLLPLRQSTIVYGRGGGAKGWLAVGIALATAAGIPFPGLGTPFKCPVIYLDWEADQIETRRRMGWLARGFGLSEMPPDFYYISLSTQPLVRIASCIRRHIDETHAGLIVVDSLVPATEDDPRDAHPARATMEAMRSFTGTTRLVVGHMTKSESRQSGGEASAYGSIFFENLARSMWQFRCRDRATDGVSIGITHTKVNMGIQFEPLGFRLKWDDANAVATFSSVSVADDPSLAGDLPLNQRIRLALRRGQKPTSTLAEELDVEPDAIRSECNVMRDVMNYGSRGGRGAEAMWGLLAKQETVGKP